MATRIRMQRAGRKGIAFYRIAVFDARTKRDGRFIEKLGFYDPLASDDARRVVVDVERYKYWVSQGAKESEALSTILRGPLGAAGVTQPVDGAGKRARRARHRKRDKGTAAS